ncbi:MAG: hypothetical protein IJX63_14500 [Lachnospiraceae bacterium]|nr:hypothetical protein [Lachnospiraceae bacterium]
MLPGLIIVGVIGYFLWNKYKKMTFMKRLAVKIVGVYVAVGFLILMGSFFLYCVGEVYIEGKESNLNYRLQQVEEDLNAGEYGFAEFDLSYGKCYEKEFDYAWERLTVYQVYNRYAICKNALMALENEDSGHVQEVEAQMAEYKAVLKELLEKSTEQKNELFVDYYEKLLYNQ